MSLDKATVAKIATLARMRLTEEEQEHFLGELNGILTWVEQLGEIDTADVPPLASVVSLKLHLRPDVVTDRDMRDQVLANAPEATEGFYVVPKVVE